MRDKYHIYLTAEERRAVINSLIDLRNRAVINSLIDLRNDLVPSPKKQTKNTREKLNEKNDKYDIKLLYSTAFIPRFA